MKRYKACGVLKTHLIINHFMILYNIFGDATTPMIFYKLERDLWSFAKTFVVFLNRLPDYPHTIIHDIEIDQVIHQELMRITNGKI
jgi:hypothetical protein